MTAQLVPPTLENLARHIDGQALAPGVQDSFDIGELVPPADLEGLAQQADPAAGRDGPDEDHSAFGNWQVIEIELEFGGQLAQSLAAAVVSDGLLAEAGLDMLLIDRLHQADEFAS